MKRLYFLVFAAAVFIPRLVSAQSAQGRPDVPITKILAIGTVTSPLTPDERKTILPKEVKGTVDLYLHGKIDQWWFRGDGKGVVFLMNVTSADEANALLEKLPLGVAGKMKFEFIPLGPLAPLKYLIANDGSNGGSN